MLTYNNAIQTVPGLLVAGPFGFAKREFFEVEDAATARCRRQPRPRSGSERHAAALAAPRAAALRARVAAPPKSFSLPAGRRRVRVQTDGSLVVDESITLRLRRARSGARYREIPLREGESIDEVVGPRGRARPTARAPAPSSAAAARPARSASPATGKGSGSSGTTRRSTEQRTFRVHYRLRGLAVAYDDVVDVNLKVWGDEWEERLGRLTATLIAPGEVERGLGPSGVACAATCSSRASRCTLRALDVPPGTVRRAPRARPAQPRSTRPRA